MIFPDIANLQLVAPAAGAKIGEGAKISVFDLHDPDLLDVGANATIGTSAWLVIGCWWMLVIM